MPTFAFQTIWSGPSGLAKDKFVNTLHFHNHTVGLIPSDYDNVRDMIKDFFITAPTGQKVTSYMTGLLNTNVVVKAYNLDEEKPRVPVYESFFTATGLSAGNPFPFEVALCLSFEAPKESGEPQSRRRNRIYLGPLSITGNSVSGRPSSSMITDVIAAASRLKSAAAASTSWDWKVYSPTDNEIHDVYRIWIDDAWDTQRRRGLAPSTRTSISS